MITVAVCTADRHASLLQTLTSLAAEVPPDSGAKILVIDNSIDRTSALKTKDQVESAVKAIDYRVVPAAGLSRARNHACELCATELIAFIDDDARPRPRWIDSIIGAFDSAPADIALVCGPVSLRWAHPRPPWLSDNLVGYLSALDLGPSPRVLDSSEWPLGTNMAFRAAALREIQGFREDLGRRGRLLIGNEEIDAKHRLSALGYRAAYVPDAGVVHEVSPYRLQPDWFRRRMFWQVVSDRMMAEPSPRARLDRIVGDSGFDPLSLVPADLKRPTDDPDLFEHQCYSIQNIAQDYWLQVGLDCVRAAG